MKILIVSSPRTGSTYLVNVLARFYQKQILKAHNSNLRFEDILDHLLDEPFGDDYTWFEQKATFDQLMKMDAWVVKVHTTHCNERTHKWITKLIKQSDIVVKLVRRGFKSTVYSHCIATARNNFGENRNFQIELDRDTVFSCTKTVIHDNSIIEFYPYDILVEYESLGYPAEIIKQITGLDVDEEQFQVYRLPKKNNATISNQDQVDRWIDEYLETRSKMNI
jgi:hypothetical protein